MIRFSRIEQVLYFGYDYPPAVKEYESIKRRLEWKMACLSDDAKRVLICLLASRESSSGFSENHCAFPVSIHSHVLPRIVHLSQERSDAALDSLLNHNFLEGESPHWGIVDEMSFHRRRIPAEPGYRRKQLSKKIRAFVLAVGKCLRCGRTDRLTVDHIKPVKMGGGDEPSNLQCLCLICNCAKRDRYIG